MSVSDIWHVSFTVADLDRSVGFYRDLLGLHERLRQEQANAYTRQLVGYPDAHLKVSQLDLPRPTGSRSRHVLELVEYVAPRGTPLSYERCDPGASHLAFLVTDLDELHTRLTAAGVTFISQPVSITEGVNRGGKTVYLRDPDGVTLELVQPPARSAREVVREPCDDGVEREHLVVRPDARTEAVAVLFHPFGFDPAAVVDGEAPGERLITRLDGAGALASRLALALVVPRGRGRVLEGVTLGWPSHLDAAMRVARRVRDELRADRIVAGGLSAGALDALLLAARFPGEVDAVWAANPIVDPAAWLEDMRSRPVPALLELGVPELMLEEVGSEPSEDPEAWSSRSALAQAERLVGTRVRLVWSPEDSIIPGQSDRQGGALSRRLRGRGQTPDERVVTHHAPAGADAGRWAHESCDVGGGLTFLAAP